MRVCDAIDELRGGESATLNERHDAMDLDWDVMRSINCEILFNPGGQIPWKYMDYCLHLIDY